MRFTQCTRCAGRVGPRSVTGVCKSCNAKRQIAAIMADPVIRARSRQTMAQWCEDRKAAHVARLQNRTIPPDEAERRREAGKALAQRFKDNPEWRRRQKDASALTNVLRGTEQLATWCPRHRIDEYRNLVRNKHYSAAEAKALILADERDLGLRAVADAAEQMRLKHARDLASRY